MKGTDVVCVILYITRGMCVADLRFTQYILVFRHFLET